MHYWYQILDTKLHKSFTDFLNSENSLNRFIASNVVGKNGEILKFPANFFQQNSNLSFLKFEQTQIDFSLISLKSLPQLGQLEISQNDLKTIPEMAQNVLLKVLKLSNNGLTKIAENTFANLIHLTEVDLSGNRFEHVPENLFKSNTNLEVLDWNDDDCSGSARTFPENFLHNNLHLRSLSYSFSAGSACQTVQFPANFFSPSHRFLDSLSVTNTTSNWSNVSILLNQLDNISIADFSNNKISRISTVDIGVKFGTLILTGNLFDCNECQTLSFVQTTVGEPGSYECTDFSAGNDSTKYPLSTGFDLFCKDHSGFWIWVSCLIIAFTIFSLGSVIIYNTKWVQVRRRLLSRKFASSQGRFLTCLLDSY